MTYRQATFKLALEQLGMLPFVLLGKLYGRLFPLKTAHSLFLFYPNADIGGSPRVNIDIAECMQDAKPLIIFSKKPKNNQFRDFFYHIPGVRVLDLQRQIDKKLIHFVNFFYRGVIASWINRSAHPVVFGGECLFFYKIIPHLRKNIPCIELSHLPTWIRYNIAFIERIDLRIFSTLRLREDVEALYREKKVPVHLFNRLRFIDNAIDIPEYREISHEQLQVVFIGRGSPQKRVHLVAAIAEKMHQTGEPVHFSFVGDVENSIDTSRLPYCTFYGNVNDAARMEQFYQQSDVLLLTSAFEGLPIVVMKMMAYGKVVLSTAVNGIPDYIRHMDNGLLIDATTETQVVEQGAALLRLILQHPELKSRLGKKSHQDAAAKFSRQVFCTTYRQLLLRDKA